MKVKIILLFLFISTITRAQDTIPNGSFERWINFGGWFDNPDGWATSNNQIINNVVKDSDSYSGHLAMNILCAGWASTSFKVYNPSRIKMYVKDSLQGDTALLMIHFYMGRTLVDSLSWIITEDHPMYEYFDHSLPMFPPGYDSIYIKISGSREFHSFFKVDYISFDSHNSIQYENQNETMVFPNPAAGELSLRFDDHSLVKPEIRIINSFGQLMLNKRILEGEPTKIDIFSLKKGFYFYEILDGQIILRIGKFVKL